MTTWLAAYDTENPRCFEALPRIVAVHERHAMPATFFIATVILDGHEAELRALLDHPLFEIASHSHSHRLLAAHHRSDAPPVPDGELPAEILGSKARLEELFGRAVTGFRPPWGYGDGLAQAPRLLALLREGGYRYVSAQLWGPRETMPALIRPPFTYAGQGEPGLLEIPGCGWHENILKRNPAFFAAALPPAPPFPGAAPAGLFETPEDEVALNRVFLAEAARVRNPHVTLIWHPWSLGAFDPEMRMLDRTFACARELGLPAATFADFAAGWSSS